MASEPTWITELVKECIEYPASSEDAVRKAIAKTIGRCAAVANGGRQYAEGDIRTVVSAIQNLATENDPWFQEELPPVPRLP